MNIKLTQIAKQELDRVSEADHSRLVKTLLDDLPRSVGNDPRIKLSELAADVRIHAIEGSNLFVLYDVRDVDGDGASEIVILTVVESLPTRDRAYDAAADALSPDQVSRSARIGHQLLSKIQQLGS